MKFHNPWIDPRIVEVQPEAARAYLLRHGWKLLGPAANPLFLLFEGPIEGPDPPTVLVPLKLDQGPMLQRMIELVGDLARYENRWAVDVLNDVLRKPIDSVPTNGLAVPAKAEPASR